jgi:hypothetical protein
MKQTQLLDKVLLVQWEKYLKSKTVSQESVKDCLKEMQMQIRTVE